MHSTICEHLGEGLGMDRTLYTIAILFDLYNPKLPPFFLVPPNQPRRQVLTHKPSSANLVPEIDKQRQNQYAHQDGRAKLVVIPRRFSIPDTRATVDIDG